MYDYISFPMKTYARELLDNARDAMNFHATFKDRLTIPPALAQWARQEEAQKQGVALVTRCQQRGVEFEANLIPGGINLVSFQNYFVHRLYNLITPQIETCVRACVCVRTSVE